MTRYVVLCDSNEVDGSFGEIAVVEASSPLAAIRKAIREENADPRDAYAAVPEHNWHLYSVLPGVSLEEDEP